MNGAAARLTSGRQGNEHLMETGTQAITAIHIVLIVVLAVLVIAGVIYGARLKRRRVAQEHAVETRAHDAGITAVETAPESERIDPPAPPPVAPSLPPIADEPAPGTPADRVGDRIADEPVAAAAPFEAGPAGEALAPIVPVSPATDDLGDRPVTLLKGLGPKVAARLGELGITSVAQIAALDDEQARALDAQLGTFSGRMERDRWIAQAKLLAAGDRAGFEAAFGKL